MGQRGASIVVAMIVNLVVVGSAVAGPADASCVYLALGCAAPTIHSIFDDPATARPPYEVAPAPVHARVVSRRFALHRHRRPTA